MYYSDNPVRDAERYQEELEARPCLVCSVCGSSLYSGEDYFDVDDEVFCPDCMNDCFKKEVDISESGDDFDGF